MESEKGLNVGTSPFTITVSIEPTFGSKKKRIYIKWNWNATLLPKLKPNTEKHVQVKFTV